jgi:MYXO-CTERM domain-containing protein
MVFENLTLFEIQIHAPDFLRRTPAADVSDSEIELVKASGCSRRVPILLFGLLAIGAAAVWRRSRSNDVSMEAELEDAEADLAAAQ